MVVTPEKMNAVAGRKIFLPCSYTCTISGITHMLVEWFRMMDGREEERLYKFPNGDRQWPLHATWMGDVSKCDASITVSDIKTNDSGRYRCEVTVYPQNKHDIGYLQLNVTSPSDKMNAMAGTTFLLPCAYTCTISGVTHMLVEWFRIIDGLEERIYKYTDGESSHWPVQATWVGDVSKCDASITVSDIQTHDSGRYRCEVTVYPQNKHDIGYLQLNVTSPSDLVVVTPDKMDAMAGTTFILPCSYTCTISGVTYTLVEWFRITVEREERIYQYDNGESSRGPLQATWVGDVSKCDASITVSDIQTHDSGRFRCEVTVYSQTMQYHIGYLQLTVQPRTDLAVVTPDAKNATVGSTALLPCSYTCTITGIRHTLVEWFRTIDGHDEKVYKIIYRKRSLRPMQVTWVGDKSTCNASITISNIQTHDAGRYRCEVTMYRHDKPSMQDIGYLQLNVHNEPEPRDATPTPTPTPAPAPVAGIVLGVIAALLVVVAGVVFYCRRRRPSQPREAEVPVEDTLKLNPNGEDEGAR
ncbi:cell adhesion molecule DSCAML1-like [Lethenteron reissneri]|uniref:cell adhesion molecule DSCAML1-like n=1 Tax=Lethenteron reissneri TaxID=7753 RepID=UPI002AB77FC6|nr:cell adhesion molecule DSCAML1-like [Lethenteron reissneri]